MTRAFFVMTVLVTAITVAPSAKARSIIDDYLTLGSISVSPVAETVREGSLYDFDDQCADQSMIPESEAKPTGELDTIVALGEKLWKLVEAGRPVVSFKTPVAHAIPKEIKCWADLENWKAPKSAVYQIVYKNLMGIEVVHFKFRMVYTYGGQRDGHGQYLANVAVVPADLSVAWGFTFNSEASVGRVVNMGTRSNPLAGMQLMVRWGLKSVVKEGMATENFFIRGDGQLERLN